MELRFCSPALAELCNRSAELDRRWGRVVGGALRERLFQLLGTPNLDLLREFPGVLDEPVRVDDCGDLRINVAAGSGILVQPDHDPIPFLGGRILACTQIEKLLVVEVNGYGR